MPTSSFIVTHAEYLASGDKLPSYGLPEFAFAGRSNVGKSSLLNALMMRKGLVRTSKQPGATRNVNLFRADVKEKGSFCLADLPGYGFAHRSKSERVQWKESLERYLLERQDLRGVVCLVDARRGPEQDEVELRDFLAQREELSILFVLTKLDKLSKSAQKPAIANAEKELSARVVGTSAELPAGIDPLWRWMISRAQRDELGSGAP